MRAFAILLFLVHSSYSLTQGEFDQIYQHLEGFYQENEYELPTAVRLGFHDCVSESCDGCIDLANPSNYGLETLILDVLEPIYNENYKDMLSRADFWAISAYAAVGRGIKNANLDCNRKNKFRNTKGFENKDKFMQKQEGCVPDLEFTFRWGRKDCPTSPNTTAWDFFPSPDMSGEAMFQYFQGKFDFTRREVTALMGAHTLGRAKGENSGYDGIWVYSGQYNFDNDFYSIMIDGMVDWQNVDNAASGSPPKYQFDGFTDGFKVGFMLNTDFELFYDLPLGPLGEAQCDVNINSLTCPHSTTYNDAFEFSENVSVFIRDFGLVFTKMLEKTTSNLQDLE